MLPRPDPQTYTRFLLSAGVFLLIAAFVLPGLVLRETDVLKVPARELSALTPVGKEEIKRRQRIARDAGGAAPYAAVLLLLAGASLVGFAVPRLRRQELKDDERSAMELDKLRVEIQPQSRYEQEERLKDEYEQEERLKDEYEQEERLKSTYERDERLQRSKAEGDGRKQAGTEAAVSTEEVPPSVISSRPSLFGQEEVKWRAAVRTAVLARIAEIVPASYEFRAQVKIAGANDLYLDGLLVSQGEKRPDVVVAIKFLRRHNLRNVGNRLADAVALQARYRARFRRRSLTWLIFVVDEPLSQRQREAVAANASKYGEALHVSLLTTREIADLSPPEAVSGAD